MREGNSFNVDPSRREGLSMSFLCTQYLILTGLMQRSVQRQIYTFQLLSRSESESGCVCGNLWRMFCSYLNRNFKMCECFAVEDF